MSETNEERDDETTTGVQLPTMTAFDLSPIEAAKFRAVLRHHFPELDGDEDMSGADTVDALARLCEALDALGDHAALETTAAE